MLTLWTTRCYIIWTPFIFQRSTRHIWTTAEDISISISCCCCFFWPWTCEGAEMEEVETDNSSYSPSFDEGSEEEMEDLSSIYDFERIIKITVPSIFTLIAVLGFFGNLLGHDRRRIQPPDEEHHERPHHQPRHRGPPLHRHLRAIHCDRVRHPGLAVRYRLVQDLPVRDVRDSLRKRLHAGSHVPGSVHGGSASDPLDHDSEQRGTRSSSLCFCGRPSSRATTPSWWSIMRWNTCSRMGRRGPLASTRRSSQTTTESLGQSLLLVLLRVCVRPTAGPGLRLVRADGEAVCCTGGWEGTGQGWARTTWGTRNEWPRMVVIVVLIFAICWLPLQIVLVSTVRRSVHRPRHEIRRLQNIQQLSGLHEQLC